jgi:rhodanese-related sulfurtransferase
MSNWDKSKIFKQILALVLISAVLGFGRAYLISGGIEAVGKWRTMSGGDGPIIPPTADEGDPAFIDIDVAQMEHSTGRTIFIDAREPDEFECGTIPGSINIPFEELPEDDLEGYLNSVLDGASKNATIVTFCSGEECDLSLHLARNMQYLGYTRVMIFFGGSREWAKFGLEVERRSNCEE